MGESIWKKELSLKRKSKQPEAAAEPVEQPVVAEQPEQPKQSVWKKEISLGRKKEPKAETPAEPKPPAWKKEVSFSRKKKDEPAEPKQSLWKKEVSLSRKKKDDDAVARLVELATKTVAPEFDEAPSAHAVAPPTQVAEAVLAAEPVADVADVHPVETLAVDEPVAAAPVYDIDPVPAYEPVAEMPNVPVEQVAYAPVAEVPSAPVEPVAVEPTPVVELPSAPVEPVAYAPVAEVPSVPVEPVAYAPVAEVPSVPAEPVAAPVAPAPVEPSPVVELPSAPIVPAPSYDPAAYAHVESAPVEQWMEPVAAEAWETEAQLPPVPEADTQVVVHPPVPAFELPPLPELKQPFWKKELSFGRKSKQATAVEAPVAAPGVHPPVPAAELPALSEAKVPFWKKEIGGSKTPKAPKEPGAEKVPFWKKELGGSKTPKAAKEPTEPGAEKVPFWKKELGGSKTPKAPKAEKAPREKKGLSFSMPSVSMPSLGGGGKGGHQVKRLVGLKVGGSQLAAARIANNGAAELLQLVRADLEPGVVVAGELRDVDSLATALKAFFAANKLPKKNVRLGIASNRIGVRTFEIAGINDGKQLENAIQFRAQEALPIPLDEAVLDYQILEERTDDEGNPVKRVLLVVAYRELVDRYVAACKKAGIVLSGIDLEAFALLRALSAPRAEDQPSDSALVAVAIGHDRSTFAVSDGRVCEFTRVLEWGGASLNIAIARALDLAPSEAEGIKRLVSLASPDVPEGVAPEHYAVAVDAVRKQVQSFARELVSSLQFYQNQPGSLGIGEIVITGGTGNLAGIADELQRLIGVRVRVGDPLARLRVTKKLAFDEPVGSLAVAIGLGIED